ncbi:hypothetical protein [Poseidonibacter ostreae]|jgi:hypothetical protein|uniref:Uncharacterized protein n=1 Tax=Poseidonibacter ostreae TaxID=2654171 RepID=A0A6L4WV23_9BACT|nr:hypothetical protein [Poseidonibacter ostreae]KAB7886844.1 hypothetical protein GA417_04590 [Poseidonibacter ostreae]KAB7890487.1 hypothetical protein GBG19_03230 [Poseidonibacter ostreae]KAB7890920.1 hypothetical protein GBG18_08110 [Poseidonibacter ostreae]MAC83137.1 hypothetical protein [Arcobacter sp.]|tara:strand:- start:4001 stop:4432 length:432 start_codon:yes stop_codon:yes gene_type:complete
MKHLDVAKQAVELVKPSINELFNKTNRKELHIVIMDPRLKPWEAKFDEAILYEESIKNSTWEKPFDDFARSKAEQAWRENQANIVTQTQHPSSLREGDLPFYGSFVYGNIVVACSGVEQWFDMLVSSWIALAFEQLMIHEHQQ